MVIVLLLLAPAAVAGRLEQAGFTEIDTVVKWKARVEDNTNALAALTAENQKLKHQLGLSDAKLHELAARLGGGAVAHVEALRRSNALAQQSANRAAATAVAAVADNRDLLSRTSKAPAPAESWAVVLAGDVSLAAARHEVDRARKAGLPTPRIYRRERSYRTVSVVPQEVETTSVLNEARSKIRLDAYPVRLTSWCPNPIEKPDHIVCA